MIIAQDKIFFFLFPIYSIISQLYSGMSAKIYYISADPVIGASPSNVSVPFISAMYILAGISMLLAILLRTILFTESLLGFHVLMALTFVLSLTGLIMSKMRHALGTINRSKFVSYFALIMSAMLFQLVGIAVFLASVYKARRLGKDTQDAMQWISLVCSIVSQILVLSAGIVLLNFTSSREYTNSPKFPLVSKLMIGIAGIIAPICGGIRPFLTGGQSMMKIFFAMYYIQITCASLVGLGIVLGIVLATLQYQKTQREELPVSQPVVTPQTLTAHANVYPSAPAQGVVTI